MSIEYDDLWGVAVEISSCEPVRFKQDADKFVNVIDSSNRKFRMDEGLFRGNYRVFNRRELVLIRQTPAETELYDLGDFGEFGPAG